MPDQTAEKQIKSKCTPPCDTKVEAPEEEEFMDVSQNIFIEPNAHFSKALPYQPTQLLAIDYVILTVSCLGIVGNLVSLVVWSSHTTYVPVIFLFKFLAVVDIQHLVSIFSWRIVVFFHGYLSNYTYFTLLYILYDLELLGQALSLHTTLLISVCRFLVVSRPLEVYNGTLLTRCQIIVACVVLFLWCLLITVPFLVITLLILNGKVKMAKVSYFFKLIVLFCEFTVISLLMIVFDVFLLKKLRSSSALRSLSVSPNLGDKKEKGRRVTLVVVLMSMCTIVAYLITGTCLAVAFVYFHYAQYISKRTYYIVFEILAPVYEFFEALNSSIKIIFYYAFFRNFRKVSPTARKQFDGTESSL